MLILRLVDVKKVLIQHLIIIHLLYFVYIKKHGMNCKLNFIEGKYSFDSNISFDINNIYNVPMTNITDTEDFCVYNTYNFRWGYKPLSLNMNNKNNDCCYIVPYTYHPGYGGYRLCLV